MAISKLLCHRDGPFDVFALGALVATAQQHDDNITLPHEVDAIAGPVIDAKLVDSVKKLRVSEQSGPQSHDALSNPFLRAPILQLAQPFNENGCPAHLDHT
jgi:hypothetical protein